jgi:hypothetical protein
MLEPPHEPAQTYQKLGGGYRIGQAAVKPVKQELRFGQHAFSDRAPDRRRAFLQAVSNGSRWQVQIRRTSSTENRRDLITAKPVWKQDGSICRGWPWLDATRIAASN